MAPRTGGTQMSRLHVTVGSLQAASKKYRAFVDNFDAKRALRQEEHRLEEPQAILCKIQDELREIDRRLAEICTAADDIPKATQALTRAWWDKFIVHSLGNIERSSEDVLAGVLEAIQTTPGFTGSVMTEREVADYLLIKEPLAHLNRHERRERHCAIFSRYHIKISWKEGDANE